MDKKDINVTRPYLPSISEYIEEIQGVWETHQITNKGIKHQELEKKLEMFFNIPHVSLFANGHLALEAALELFQFPHGSEVITTPFTFASTIHAIIRKGLVPVFCDIKESDFTIDPEKIQKLITEKTVAILPVHVYGYLCDVDKIKEIAERNGLKVIYDAAHAFGVSKNEKSVAEFGDVTMFSFHATKVFHTIEGGAICFREDEFSKIAEDIKNFGIRNKEKISYIGGNAKMNEFQAAMGLCNLRHVETEIVERARRAEYYRYKLSEIPGIRIVKQSDDVKENYAYMPVIFDGYKYSRDEIAEKLEVMGIYARKYFSTIMNEVEYENRYWPGREFYTPIAKKIAERVLCLPLYGKLGFDEIDRVCDLIISYTENGV